MGGFKGKGLVLSSSGLTRVSEFCALAVSDFCSRAGNLFTFCWKTQRAPGRGMGRFKGRGLVLRGMLTRPHKVCEFSAQRLAGLCEFCRRADNLRTIVGKHKAHPGAVRENSGERVWFFAEFSWGLTGVSKFCAYSAQRVL